MEVKENAQELGCTPTGDFSSSDADLIPETSRKIMITWSSPNPNALFTTNSLCPAAACMRPRGLSQDKEHLAKILLCPKIL